VLEDLAVGDEVVDLVVARVGRQILLEQLLRAIEMIAFCEYSKTLPEVEMLAGEHEDVLRSHRRSLQRGPRLDAIQPLAQH
jgi:hypothetical protein